MGNRAPVLGQLAGRPAEIDSQLEGQDELTAPSKLSSSIGVLNQRVGPRIDQLRRSEDSRILRGEGGEEMVFI